MCSDWWWEMGWGWCWLDCYTLSRTPFLKIARRSDSTSSGNVISQSRGLQKRLLHGSDCLTILLLGAICRYARCRNDPRKSRVHQRDSRLAHLEDRGPRSEPRLRDRATPATNIERLISCP